MTAVLPPLIVGLALFAKFGIFGPEAADAQWVEIVTSTPLAVVAFGAAGVLSLWLMLKEGQPRENRYGPAPL